MGRNQDEVSRDFELGQVSRDVSHDFTAMLRHLFTSPFPEPNLHHAGDFTSHDGDLCWIWDLSLPQVFLWEPLKEREAQSTEPSNFINKSIYTIYMSP